MEEIQLKTAIQKVKQGEIQYFNILVKTYEKRLRMLLAGVLLNKGIVDDIAQEAFIIAYNKIDLYNEKTPFYAWLKGIALNLARNANRKYIKQQKDVNKFLEFQTYMENIRNRESSYIDKMVLYLEECIKRLPEKIANILKEYYANQRKSSEIAKLFDLTEGNIRVMMMRARLQLKTCIENKIGR